MQIHAIAVFLKNASTPRVKSVGEGFCELETLKDGDHGGLGGGVTGYWGLRGGGFSSRGKSCWEGGSESLCFDRTTPEAMTTSSTAHILGPKAK